MSKEHDAVLLNVSCMAACYSTDPDGTVRLPFDPATGELREDVWRRSTVVRTDRRPRGRPGHGPWTSSTRTPSIPAGWRNATLVPREPRRGASSTGRNPAARSRSSSRPTSATR